MHAEDLEARPEFKNVAQNVGTFGLSPSGARAVLEARGNVFTVPAEHGSIRTLTTDNSSVHELNPAWSPDGKWIAYLSDKTGEYELYLRPQMGGRKLALPPTVRSIATGRCGRQTARNCSIGTSYTSFGGSASMKRNPCR